ncbi:Pentatricopeptide repeat-containing protein [Phytophthora nicotianae]|uniref:Pentatricopeptide repeat-containing protein n=1 Tax=Phytophthora nicotianae TaxID=4792 RepID=A0A0W8C6D2_PHYNI|nr:Pentatricopeptide repeat-containing protein [Phytophthora nicotianae]
MLNAHHSIRGALAAGRYVSQLCGTSGLLPSARDSAVPSCVAWGSSSSSSPHPGHLTIICRSFSQMPSQEPSEAAKKLEKRKFYRPKKPNNSAGEAAKKSDNLTRLQANPGDTDVALEVLASIQSANGSGLSKDVANMLVKTLTTAHKFDRALWVLELSIKRKILLMTPPYAKLMTACYKAGKHDTVLKVFALYDIEDHASRAFQVALGAAVKSRQHDLVLTLMECSKALDVVLTSEHYLYVLKSYAGVGDMQAALGIRDTLQTNGFELDEDGIHWLVHCASKADQWDLVQELLGTSSIANDEKVAATVNVFNAAIAGYGNKERWDRVVDVYDIMPENIRAELKGWHLGTIVLGHAKVENKELKLRALEIFNEHKEKANAFTYGGAITALLETEQFDAALELAEDMKTKDIAWDKVVYQAVALALICRGTPQEAVQLLEESVRRLGDSPEGYLAIIDFYINRHSDQDANES